jgi:ribosomal protein S18 acetylase RimI-like enzyme
MAAAQEDPNVVDAYLHVQTSNEEAIRFYQRAGFQIAETLMGYYRKNRLSPPDAYILRKPLVNCVVN